MMFFSKEKIEGSAIDLSAKGVSSLDKHQLKNMGPKLCFCYLTHRKLEKFFEVLPLPLHEHFFAPKLKKMHQWHKPGAKV